MYVGAFSEIIPDLYDLEREVGSEKKLKYYEKTYFKKKRDKNEYVNESTELDYALSCNCRYNTKKAIVSFKDGKVVGYILVRKYESRCIKLYKNSKDDKKRKYKYLTYFSNYYIDRVVCANKETLEHLIYYFIETNVMTDGERGNIICSNKLKLVSEIFEILKRFYELKEKLCKYTLKGKTKAFKKIIKLKLNTKKEEKVKEDSPKKYIDILMYRHQVEAVDTESFKMGKIIKKFLESGMSIDNIIKEKNYIIEKLNANLIDKYSLIDDVFEAQITHSICPKVYCKMKKTNAIETLKKKLKENGFVETKDNSKIVEPKAYIEEYGYFIWTERKKFSFYIDPVPSLSKYRIKFKKIAKLYAEKNSAFPYNIYVYNRYGYSAFYYAEYHHNENSEINKDNKIKLIPYYNSKTFDDVIKKHKFLKDIQEYIKKFYNECIPDFCKNVLWRIRVILKEQAFLNCINSLIVQNDQIGTFIDTLLALSDNNNIEYLTKGALEKFCYSKKCEKNEIKTALSKLSTVSSDMRKKIDKKRLRKVLSKLIKKGEIAQINYEIDCEIMRIQKII